MAVSAEPRARTPDPRLFPDFDDNLRQAFRRETELFFESIMHEDRSVLDLLRADYTFLNERLAKHYGIPNVYGSHFRRVTLDRRQPARRAARSGQHPDGHLVRQPDLAGAARQVDARKHSRDAAAAAAAERAAAREQRRARKGAVDARADGRSIAQSGLRELPSADGSDRACRSRTSTPSAAGAAGRRRRAPIDASGGLPDGSTFDGVAGLRQALS